MVVRTQTERLSELRKGVMELYVSDHPLDCLTCSANGDCELQDMAGAVGLREVRYGFEGENHVKPARRTGSPTTASCRRTCRTRTSPTTRQVHRLQSLRARLRGGAGHLRAHHRPAAASTAASAAGGVDFLGSDCVSCGACVQACPTATLMENKVIELGQPEHAKVTTCAYCGVGCSFKAEMQGGTVVRMVPYKDGKANEGHSCVKGRFAWGYATHQDRILKPMIRERITDPWREVSWDEAIGYAASEFKRIQAEHGRNSVGAITSSRCTNEEVFLVQKLARAAFGNNNVDTCARVCHSPTGYGLKTTLGTSAGTQDFKSVAKADVILVIGANPTDGHPVFASRMKKRLRQGARLIVVDPRRIDLVDSPHIKAAITCS
jgi:formate dehydrogenase major subunit